MSFYDPSRLVAAMDGAGCDALVATTAPNVQYLTGYRKPGSSLAVVCRSEPARPVLVVAVGEVDFCLEEPVDQAVVKVHGEFYRETASHARVQEPHARVAELHSRRRPDVGRWDLVAEAVADVVEGRPTIGTDGGRDAAHELSAVCEQAVVELTTDVFRNLRAVKGPEEIRRLGEVARLTESAIDLSVRHAGVGVTQLELARAFRRCAAETDSLLRSDSISIDGGAALGNVNVPGDLVETGSVIRYDVGLICRGYASDISRCFSFLDADPKVVDYHAALVAGQAEALAALQPGVRANEVFKVAVDGVRAAGLYHYRRTHVGHGIGIAGGGYDKPLLGPDDETPLQAGMVLCVETPYYELGFTGLQVEDMVVITEDGHESLTRSERDLRVLP